jgi:hypothetical protein
MTKLIGVINRKNTRDIIIGLIILFSTKPNFNHRILNGCKTDGMNIAKMMQLADSPTRLILVDPVEYH